jgi:hypothetical protein
MPLLIGPYTFGSGNIAAGAPALSGGAAYYGRRKRFIAYILTMLLLSVILR